MPWYDQHWFRQLRAVLAVLSFLLAAVASFFGWDERLTMRIGEIAVVVGVLLLGWQLLSINARINKGEWDMDRFKKSSSALPILREMEERSREDNGPHDRFLARRIREID